MKRKFEHFCPLCSEGMPPDDEKPTLFVCPNVDCELLMVVLSPANIRKLHGELTPVPESGFSRVTISLAVHQKEHSPALDLLGWGCQDETPVGTHKIVVDLPLPAPAAPVVHAHTI